MNKGTSNPPPSSQSPEGSPHGGGSAREPDETPHDRAGGSPQNLAKPQPKANAPAPEGGPIDLNDTPMSGASGFVGILARRQPGPGDSHMPVDGEAGASEAQARRKKYELHMAREVEAADVAPPKSAADAQAAPPLVPPIPEPRPRVPVILIAAIVLFVIGLWAAGAIFYMQAKSPNAAEDVHYPFLQWGEPGGYADQSIKLAWGAVLCLPVSLALGALVVWRRMWRRWQGR